MSSTTTSTLGVLDTLYNDIFNNDYQYTSASAPLTAQQIDGSVPALHSGDKVYANGHIYQYSGPDLAFGSSTFTTTLGAASLAGVNYSGSHWSQLNETTFAQGLATKVGNITDSDSRAIGGIVVYNEVSGRLFGLHL